MPKFPQIFVTSTSNNEPRISVTNQIEDNKTSDGIPKPPQDVNSNPDDFVSAQDLDLEDNAQTVDFQADIDNELEELFGIDQNDKEERDNLDSIKTAAYFFGNIYFNFCH